jgi:cytochrome c oxidase assembly protein subunit 15
MALADNLTWLTVGAAATAAGAPTHASVRVARAYFSTLAALGLAAFMLGVENRLTPALFVVAPPVDLVPPLGAQAWYAAFLQHQQDPVFAACGGTENLAQFKLLYWWEWLRRGSVLLLGGLFVSGLSLTALAREYRFAFKRHLGLCALGVVYLALVLGLDGAPARVVDFARYNVGQYRHVLDVTFASVALALVLAAAIAPPTAPKSRASSLAWLWIALIILDIAAGALFAARDAAPVWRSFPGYDSSALPPLERLTAYTPLWLNFTFNQYMIQLVHRALSLGLWVGLAGAAIWTSSRYPRRFGILAALLLVLTVEMLAGIAALMLGAAALIAFLHEVGPMVLLAIAFVMASRPKPA